MSFKDIETALQGVQDTVRTGQNQLTSALEFLENARELLQGTADHSVVAEHAQAVGLFQDAEQDLIALRARLEQFHPAVASYLGSLGMNAPAPDPDVPPQPTQDKSASDSNKPEPKPDSGQAPPDTPATEAEPTTDAEPPTSEPTPKAEPQFKEVAEDLQAQVARTNWERTSEPKDITGYIGEGVENYVFDIADGTKVAKVAKYGTRQDRSEASLPEIQEKQAQIVEAMERVKGREGYEQLDEVIDASPHLPAVMIYDKAPGVPLTTLSPEELDTISEEHMDKLVGNVVFASQNNIQLDTMGAGDNVLYDAKKGFTIIDFTLLENASQFKMPSDAEMVSRYARHVLFDNPQPGMTPLPPAQQTFYRSFKKAFGDDAARRLKLVFSIRYTLPEDL